MAAALVKRAIYAAPFSPPTNLEVQKSGGRVLIDMAKAGIPFPHVSIVTTRSFIRKNRPVALAFLRAYSEGIKRMVGDRAFSLQVLEKYTRSTDPEVLEATYKFALDYIVRVPYPTREGIAEILKDSQSPKAKDAKPGDFIDDSIVRELEKGGLPLTELFENLAHLRFLRVLLGVSRPLDRMNSTKHDSPGVKKSVPVDRSITGGRELGLT